MRKFIHKLATFLVVIACVTFQTNTAFARILFEDDAFFSINSEGIMIDANNNAGTDPINLQFGNDGTDGLIQYNPTTGDFSFSTPGGDFSFSDDDLTSTGAFFFQDSSEFHIREVADEAVAKCSTLNEIVLDTTQNTIYVCTGVGNPGTWVNIATVTAGDLQSAYDADGGGVHEILLAAGDGEAVEIRADANGDDLFQLQNSVATNLINFQDAGGGTIDIDSLKVDWDVTGDFDLDLSSSFSLDATGASNISTTGGELTISTLTSGNVRVLAADNITFDDAQITGVIQLSDIDSDWAATLGGNGIVDNINSFTSIANGEGASNVGIEDASAWFTGAEIETALNEIEALFGSTSSSVFDFTEDNVLSNNDAVYTALNRFDLKWGDLASTGNSEGASLVGIEDAGGFYASSNVEGALQELGGDINANFENLTFFPEYPDTVIFPDGSNNLGTLEAFYDTVEETGYYRWTTQDLLATNDIDLRFAFALPHDFSNTADFIYRYRTGTVTEVDNDVEIRLYNLTDTQECANDLSNGTANAWATGTITAASINTGCTGGTALDAGDYVEVQIKLFDNSGAEDFADIARLIWNYVK